MPKTNKSSKQVCEFCQFGTEVRVCGRLWQISQAGLTVTAHHKCMQYSAGLVQYKNEFTDFGNFDPKEVKKEVKRGNKLKCHICKNRHGSATAGCALNICPHSFHFLCAKQDPNRTTLVKKINVYQGEGEGVLDEYVIFCKLSHKHAFDKKRDEAYKYVDSSDDEAAPWNRYGYGYPSPGSSKKGSSSKKRSPPKESPRKSKRRSPDTETSSNTSKRKSPTISDEEMLNDPKLTGENELKIVLKKCTVEKDLSSSKTKDELSVSQRHPEIETTEDDSSSQKSMMSDNVANNEQEKEIKDKLEDKKGIPAIPGSSSFDPLGSKSEMGWTEDAEKNPKSETHQDTDEALKTSKKRSSPDDSDSPTQTTKVQKMSSPVTPKQQKPKGYRRHPFFAQTDGHMDSKSPLSSPLSSPQAQAANLLAPLKQVVQKVWQSMQLDTSPMKSLEVPSKPPPGVLTADPPPYSSDIGVQPLPKKNLLPALSECVNNPAASQRVIGTLMSQESNQQSQQEVWDDDLIEPCIKQEPDTSPISTPAPTFSDNSPFMESQMSIDSQSSQFTQTIKNEPDEVLKNDLALGNNGFNPSSSRSKESSVSSTQLSPSLSSSHSQLNPTNVTQTLTCPSTKTPNPLPHSSKLLSTQSSQAPVQSTIQASPGAPIAPVNLIPGPPVAVRPAASTDPVSDTLTPMNSAATSFMAPAAKSPTPTSLTPAPTARTSVLMAVAPQASTMTRAPQSSTPLTRTQPVLTTTTPGTSPVPNPMTHASLVSTPVTPTPQVSAPLTPAPMAPTALAPAAPYALTTTPEICSIQQPNIIDPSDIRIASITPVSKSPQHSALLESPSPPTRGSNSPDSVVFSPSKNNVGKNSNGHSNNHPNKPYHQHPQITKSLDLTASSPHKPSISASSYEQRKSSELTERLHGIMSGNPCKDSSTLRKKVPSQVPSQVPNQSSMSSPKLSPRHASTRSDAVLCMVNLNRIDRQTLDFIYTSALTMFGVKRHQVLMKYMPPNHSTKESSNQRVKFNGLLHLKEMAESLSSKDLQSVQKLALDKNMQVYADKHKTFSFDMYPTLLDIVKAILQESDLKYNYSIAKMLRLQKDDNAVAFMLHLNESTDPGFKVRAVYNNIFIWNPNTQVNFEQELCDPEREYATIQSWLDKQITQGISPYYKPSDSILLRPNDQSVIKRLKEKVLEQTFEQPTPPENARKVYFIGPMDESVIPKASTYLKKCIPRITEQLDSQCSLVLCVIAIDRSIQSIKDVCAPLPGFDMNILTVFDPSEFCPSCFVLKIARRKKTV